MPTELQDRLERIAIGSREQFERVYSERRQPFVITNAISDWPAIQKWNQHFFAKEFKERQIQVEERVSALRQYENTAEVSMGDYIQHLEAGTRNLYFGDQNLAESIPDLQSDFHRPDFIPDVHEPIAWMGRDTFTGLHLHRQDEALLCQVEGTKNLVLIPPSFYNELGPGLWFLPSLNWSNLLLSDFEEACEKIEEKIGRSNLAFCSLSKGEALFIPLHWWHCVAGIDWSFSVTFFWKATEDAWERSPLPRRFQLGNFITQKVYRPLESNRLLTALYHNLRARNFGG